MKKIDAAILTANKVISSNIDNFGAPERGLLSQNILSHLRNLVEAVSLKPYSNGQDIEVTYSSIQNAIEYVKTRGELRFLRDFHRFLQTTASHYTLDEGNSERLMLKYYEYLLKTKIYLKKTFNLDILENIDEFPLETDAASQEYYEAIAEKINQPRANPSAEERYYIQKVKPFFVKSAVYYEVTFTRAHDKASKFDQIIAFTNLDISKSYAAKLWISADTVRLFGKDMPINFINKWEISIRQCELNNFAKIFGAPQKINSSSVEYRNLMQFLTRTHLNLSEIVCFSDAYYAAFGRAMRQEAQVTHFLDTLDKCRAIVKNQNPGSNVIKYLLYRLNNKIIKLQYASSTCNLLSNLFLDIKCIPFDQIPYNTSLMGHNPRISDIYDCIDPDKREHELLARFIRNNTEIEGSLYTAKSTVDFKNVDALIQKYNNSLYYKHANRKIGEYKGNLYITEYEKETVGIIQKIKELSSSGDKGYSKSVEVWLAKDAYGTTLDSEEKKEALVHLFESSKVAFLYGSAGTGKSTMINYISNFFNGYKKLYLTNTNPANDNLRRKISASNWTFKTIAKFLSNRNTDRNFDILVIDECSTVSNKDMLEVLEKTSFRLLVLVGDVFQIESISFGNWFEMSKHFISSSSIFELTKPWRTTNPKLIELWSRIRNLEDDILEHITKNNYSAKLDESIFNNTESDEIILCLNYDGIYGINNINRFLQNNNENEPVRWWVHNYKVGDPILFNESERFSPAIYNNLKGWIIDIVVSDDRIQFDIEIDKTLSEFDIAGLDLGLIWNADDGNSIVRFSVSKYKSTDEDDDNSLATVVPFQIAYAVSIHKAQWLEYDSVKIVIADEVEEMITHNILYTAITRAKAKLKIYWSPETENKILKNLKRRDSRKDVALLSEKYELTN